MKPVHILVGMDGGNHLVGIDLGGQRQLHQNPVHRGIGIQLFNQSEQIRLGRFRGQDMFDGSQTRFRGHFDLGAHIDLTGGIIAHQHNRQTGLLSVHALIMGRLSGHFFPQRGRNHFAVNPLCRHEGDPSLFNRSNVSCNAARSISTSTVFKRAVWPVSNLIFDLGICKNAASVATRAVLAAPSSGTARTRIFKT